MQKTGAIETTRRANLLPGLASHFRFEFLAIATIVLTYGLIVLGGAVRATDSGTACPDWPLCHGQVLPRLEGHVLVEDSHRLVASIVGVLMFATAIWAWRRNRNESLVAGAALLAALHYAHRLLAAGLGVLMLALAAVTWRRERRLMVIVAVGVALAIYVAQVFVGAANIWLTLATPMRILHLALASALWAVLAFTSAWSYLRPGTREQTT